jgi:hypothetical protein
MAVLRRGCLTLTQVDNSQKITKMGNKNVLK